MSVTVSDVAVAAVLGPDLDNVVVHGHEFHIRHTNILVSGGRSADVNGSLILIRNDLPAEYLYSMSVTDAILSDPKITIESDSIFGAILDIAPAINRATGSKLRPEELDQVVGALRRLAQNDVAKETALLIISYIALIVKRRAEADFRPTQRYLVTVQTGSDENAGTSAQVHLNLHGVGEAISGDKRLLGSGRVDNFESESRETIELFVDGTGELRGVSIGHDNTGDKPGWLLNTITVETEGKRWDFAWNDWIATDARTNPSLVFTADGAIETPELRPSGAIARYKIRVKTSNKDSAGTDASVWIILIGQDRQTRRCILGEAGVNNFERNKLDEFIVDAEDVGTIEEIGNIIVGHDNRGEKPGWHLEWIEIRKIDSRTGNESLPRRLNWNKWLAADVRDPQVMREGREVRTYELSLA